MTIFWKPNGSLDVATDPCDLAQQVSGSNITSVAMQRCKNLRLDRQGVVTTRDGSAKVSTTALSGGIHRIFELNGNRYVPAGSKLYYNEASIATGLADDDWSGVVYNSFNSTVENVFCLNGTDRKRLEAGNDYEWGIDAPTVAPALAAGGGTGLTGDYYVKYTYCRKVADVVVCESNPSPASAVQTLTDQSLRIAYTRPADAQITHVRFYRTVANGLTYYHDQDVAKAAAQTTYDYSYTYAEEMTGAYISGIGHLFAGTKQASDTTIDTKWGTTAFFELYYIFNADLDTTTDDGSLGTEVATDHDRPPLGTFVAGPSYNGYLFILKDNLLYFCQPSQPEYWPATYYVEVCPPHETGQCLVFFNGQPYVLTKHRIYYIQGTGYNTYFPLPMDSITGVQGPQAAVSVHGKGIYHVGSDGLYLWAGVDLKITQATFDPIFRGETVSGVPGATSLANSWLIQFRGRLYYGYTSSGYTYPTNALVFNLTNDRVSYYTWGQEIRTVTVDTHNDRILAADNSGHIWELEVPGSSKDNGTDISWEVEGKNFVLQTRANFPRWVKYDVDASSAVTATGGIYLDDSLHQSHTLNEDRNTRKRLVAPGNGKRMSVRISGSGPVEIYAVEVE